VDGLKDDVEYYIEQAREEGYEADLELYAPFEAALGGTGERGAAAWGVRTCARQ
jgi:hypothetical protein